MGSSGRPARFVEPGGAALWTSAFLGFANRGGRPHAELLAERLDEGGVKTWLAVRDVNPSLDFTAQLEKAIRTRDVFITCITEDVQREDSFVRREILFAQLYHKPIAVARFEDVVPPISVVTNTFFEFHEDWEEAFTRLLAFCRAAQPAPALTP